MQSPVFAMLSQSQSKPAPPTLPLPLPAVATVSVHAAATWGTTSPRARTNANVASRRLTGSRSYGPGPPVSTAGYGQLT